MHLIGIILVVAFSLPPAVSTIAVLTLVYTVIQALKLAPWFAPYLKGWVAIVINLALNAFGTWIAVPATQFWTLPTITLVIVSALGSAGIHGTVKSTLTSPPASPTVAQVVKMLLLAVCLSTVLMGCNKAAPLPAGAYTPADASTNADLQAAHAALVQYSTDVASGKHVPTAQEKVVVNKLIDAVNIADSAYQSYHATLATNPAAPEPAALVSALATVVADLPAVEALIK